MTKDLVPPYAEDDIKRGLSETVVPSEGRGTCRKFGCGRQPVADGLCDRHTGDSLIDRFGYL